MDNNENMELVQNIVIELEKYASGCYFLHDGELFPIDYNDFNACGGPNIYIDSYSGEVQLYWWSERATAVIPANICDEINAVFQEFYYC